MIIKMAISSRTRQAELQIRKENSRGRGVIVAEKNKTDYSKIPFTGLGLIFGTAIGAALSLIITGNVIWAGVGTGIGLVIGAAIDGYKKRQ
ncbi:hypothetical protein DHX103_00305 [Planococcus sp. X10-3]|uniref:hypothetical protein n=1 Tax=Planococcus sp. X10-3 TaxID=3061240 RepID=UPI003BB18444